MVMENYIYQLLANNNRIIIPGLGALIVKNDPSKTIYFNEFLKFNDGLLVNFVAEKEKIDVPASTQKVNEFAEELTKILNSGKSVKIGEAGSLTKDSSGKIIFENDGQSNDAENARFQPGAKEPENNADSFTSTIEPPVSKPLERPVEKPKPAEEFKTNIAPPKVDTKTSQSSKYEPKPVQRSKDIQSKAIKPQKKEKPVKTSGPKNYKGITISAIIIIPIIALCIWIFAFNGQKTLVTMKHKVQNLLMAKISKPKPETVALVKSDSTKTSSIKTPPPVAIKDTKQQTETKQQIETKQQTEIKPPASTETVSKSPKQQTSPNGKRYYIIGGSFKSEQNAENYIKKLKNKGYDSEKIEKIGEFHTVSIKSADTKEEALVELKKIKKDVEPNAWLLYR